MNLMSITQTKKKISVIKNKNKMQPSMWCDTCHVHNVKTTTETDISVEEVIQSAHKHTDRQSHTDRPCTH